MMFQSSGTQHAKQRPFTKCSTYQLKFEGHTGDKHHLRFFLLEKTITKLWQDCESTICIKIDYFFSACHQSCTADPEDFFHTQTVFFLEVEEKNPHVSFLECPYISVASPALRLDLNAERWWSFTKRPAARGIWLPSKKASDHMDLLLLLLLLFSSWES